MRMALVAGLVLCGVSSPVRMRAQGVDPNLTSEVAAVRAEVARSLAGLRQYIWTEHTEVLVKGKVKSSIDLTCRDDGSGGLIKTPIGQAKEKDSPSAVSKRPMVRKKADMQDYIDRAVNLVHSYVPPKPEQLDYLVRKGYAALGRSETGKSEIRFRQYLQEGDSFVFTYDPVSKALLRVSVTGNLGSPKDPVDMEAVFETLPDGVNHLASATLNAKTKKVQVIRRNVMYQKVPH